MVELKINKEIKVRQVRIVGIEKPGIYDLKDALKLASDLNLDLVEINSTTEPPICRIIDYQKYQYQQKKKLKENKSKQTQIETKEIRLGFNIGDNDLLIKERQAAKFLENGKKVLVSMFFKGRSIVYSNEGKEKIETFISDLSSCGEIEKNVILVGRKITAIIKPKKK